MESILKNLLYVISESKNLDEKSENSGEESKLVSSFLALKNNICEVIAAGNSDLKVEMALINDENLN